jgi:hypothetical protein
MSNAVRDNSARDRYELELAGGMAFVTYHRSRPEGKSSASFTCAGSDHNHCVRLAHGISLLS